MSIEIQINDSPAPGARYVTWAPSPCKIRLTDTTGITQPVTVRLRNKPGGTGGRVVFRRTLAATPAATLSLTLPLTGASVKFFIAGQFGRASFADGDAAIQARRGTTTLGEFPLMVRIR